MKTPDEKDFEWMVEFNLHAIRQYHMIAMAQGKTRPVMFLLDLRDPLAAVAMDGMSGSEGTAEILKKLVGKDGKIPTGHGAMDADEAKEFLDLAMPGYFAECIEPLLARKDHLVVVVISAGKIGVDTAPIEASN